MTAALGEARRMELCDIVLTTLGAHSDDPNYARTRAFYEVQGFRALVGDHMAGGDHAMMWMIRSVDRGS
jgi:hypothetical protein